MSRRVEKPWRYEEIWAETSHYVGKILFIRTGSRLSLQHHDQKEETMRLHSGSILLELEDDQGSLQTSQLAPGDCVHIPPRRKHRLKALEDSLIYEVSTTQLNDVIRHEDDYGRI